MTPTEGHKKKEKDKKKGGRLGLLDEEDRSAPFLAHEILGLCVAPPETLRIDVCY